MRPAEEIERLLIGLKDRSSVSFDRRTLADMFSAQTMSTCGGPARSWQEIGRAIMHSRITKLAAAAVLALAVLLLARHLAGHEKAAAPGWNKDTVARTPPSQGTPAPAALAPKQDQLLLAQEQAAREYFAKADVKGLLGLLETGQDQTRIVAADLLARMGEKSALPALEKLAAQWTGPAADNPFRRSVEQIQAASAQENKTDTKTPAQQESPVKPPEPESGAGTLTVRVSEKATGHPLPDASIRAWTGQAWQTNTADDKGVFTLDLGGSVPERVMIGVTEEGYVGQLVTLRDLSRGKLPKTIEFSLDKGTVIGGVVQDGAGRPVKGARVESYIQEPQKLDQPCVNVSLKETTDEQGRWRSTCVPAQVTRLWFNVYHPQFADGGFEMPKNLKLDDLRAERAVMVMKEGLAVAGRVTDAAGNPIVGAELLAGEDYFARDWTKTDAAGRFEFLHLKPLNAAFLLTVQARGYAPQRREVPSEKGLAPIEFVLQPAKLLVGRVVDPAGRPVAGAFVVTEGWNHYCTVRWQTTTDAKGMFTWDYPPADAIEIRISKKAYREIKPSVTANGLEQTFVLAQPVTIQGSVTDGRTGKPVGQFKVTPGIQDKSGDSITWQTSDGWFKWFTDGRYSYTFSSDGRAYAVRIEADGYVPGESRLVDANEPQATIDIVLAKGEGPSGYVFDADSRPVAGAEVYWKNDPMIENGQPVNKQYLTRATTDSSGHFAFPPDNRKDTLVALCDRGMGIVTCDELARTGSITLTPWARVQGDLRIGRQPGGNRKLQLSCQSQVVQKQLASLYYDTTTDQTGRFVFERVCPGEFALYNQEYQIAPGQTLELHLGGTGRTVTGELVLPATENGSIWAGLFLVTRPPDIPFDQFPKPPGYEQMTVKELQAWVDRYGASPEGKAYLAWLKKAYPQVMGKSLRVEMDDQRKFHVDNVEPGVYALRGTVQRSAVHSGSEGTPTIGRLWHEVVVPPLTQESQLDVPLDVGALIAVPGELKPGDPAPDFDVPTFGMDRVRLQDYRGKVLLVGFYSCSYEGGNVRVMDDLKSAYQRFHENPRYAQVDLVFTQYLPLDRKALEEGGLNWPHGLVTPEGKESTEYGLRGTLSWSVLVGPRGEVLAVGLSGDALSQAIEQALHTSQ